MLRQGYKSKFDSLGLDVQAEEIFSSSFAAAAYLEQVRVGWSVGHVGCACCDSVSKESPDRRIRKAVPGRI